MSWFSGAPPPRPPPTQKEILRAEKQNVQRSTRDIGEEDHGGHQEDGARVLAKELVRIRAQIQRLKQTQSKLQGVSTRLTTVNATVTMARATESAGRAMASVNQQMNIQATQKIMTEFERQSEMANMKEEMIDEMFEDISDEETDDVLAQVSDELGLEIGAQLVSAPTKALPTTERPAALSVDDQELERKMRALLES